MKDFFKQFGSTFTAIIVAGLLVLSFVPKTAPSTVGDATFNRFQQSVVTNTHVSVSASTSTLVLAGTGGRQFVALSNDSSNNIYCFFGDAATVDNGILLSANGVMTLDYANLYTGDISCIAKTATSTLTITYAQ